MKTRNFRTEEERPTHEYATNDALVLEHFMTGTVTGQMLGMPGNNRRITFRILHVFEFHDGLISRENVWLDTAAIVGQLVRAAHHWPRARTRRHAKLTMHPRPHAVHQLSRALLDELEQPGVDLPSAPSSVTVSNSPRRCSPI